MADGRMGTTGFESGLSASYHSYEPEQKTSRLVTSVLSHGRARRTQEEYTTFSVSPNPTSTISWCSPSSCSFSRRHRSGSLHGLCSVAHGLGDHGLASFSSRMYLSKPTDPGRRCQIQLAMMSICLRCLEACFVTMTFSQASWSKKPTATLFCSLHSRSSTQ